MSVHMFTVRLSRAEVERLEGIFKAEVVAYQRKKIGFLGEAYMEAIARGDIELAASYMEAIEVNQKRLDMMVPRAGVEPALLSETDFESAASTSSANGATDAEYNGHGVLVNKETLPHSTPSNMEPPFEVRLARLLSHLELPNGWDIKCGYYTNSERVFLQIEDPNGKCNVTGAPEPWRGRKWALSSFMTDGEIINTAWKAVMTAAEHELREGFKFKGVTIFDPHYDPHALADFMKNKGSRTWRDDGMTEVA